MRLAPEKLIIAQFVTRPNRFLVRCRIEKRVVEAMMPNPGRLTELLLPGATLYVSEDLTEAEFEAQAQEKQVRKTRFTVWAVEREGEPVFLHTHRTNSVAEFLLRNKKIPSLASTQIVRGEVLHGNSRFDFLMENAEEQGEVSCKEPGYRFFLEVKSVTLFGNGAALFPDAITNRGRRHLLELADIGGKAIKEGRPRPVVLFLVHSNRVSRFLPDYHTDLEFSRTFLDARDGVRLKAVSVAWNRSLELEPEVRELPIPWEFLNREVTDRGSYLLMLRLDQSEKITVKRLGELSFSAGWYIYVGSAMRNLTQRIARHQRKRKRFHWHIDFLRDRASKVTALPIRSSLRLECKIAESLSHLLQTHSRGFGSSDCNCPTHLYFSPEDPLGLRPFHDLLESFRMPEPQPGCCIRQ